MTRPPLTIKDLLQEAKAFANKPPTFGCSNNSKELGTMIETAFKEALEARYALAPGNAASGIDLPDVQTDIKFTRKSRRQSSCPYTSAEQKIFGLGYSLLVFSYETENVSGSRDVRPKIVETLFIEASVTGDYRLTRELSKMVKKGVDREYIVRFLLKEENLPVDEAEAYKIADRVLHSPPKQGYLTVTDARQWRLTYKEAVKEAGAVQGVTRL